MTCMSNIVPLAIVCAAVLALPHPCLSGEKPGDAWSYALAKDTEASSRSYLLVYLPGTKAERRIAVTSRCRKPHQAEGAYGSCTHAITVQPAGRSFTLDTGEDVVMVSFTWDAPLILATVAYGCCGGPDTARFYTEAGDYLGFIEGHDLDRRANYRNVIARTFDMGNATRDGDTLYLLVTGKKNAAWEAIVFKDMQKRKRVPVSIPLQGPEDCDEWHIGEFVKYGDKPDLTLKMNGIFCRGAEEGKEQVFSCRETGTGLACAPEKGGNTTGGTGK
jgi:hypothetical protein